MKNNSIILINHTFLLKMLYDIAEVETKIETARLERDAALKEIQRQKEERAEARRQAEEARRQAEEAEEAEARRQAEEIFNAILEFLIQVKAQMILLTALG